MNSLWKRFRGRFALYLAMQEMRVFWLFCTLILAVLITNFFYLHIFWALFDAVILIGVGIIVFIGSIKTARANLALRVARDELKGIVTALRDGVIAYDQNFKVLEFNPAAEQIFNFKASEVIGRSFSLDLKERGDPRFHSFLMVLFPALAPVIVRRSGPNEPVQVLDMSLTNPALELRVATSKLVSENGLTLGTVKVVRDRTRETELLRSKSEFITVASHQLRAPLTALSWAFESLNDRSTAEERADLIKTATKATQNLHKVVDDLLDVAKIEEGRFGYQFQEINIIDFIENALRQAELVARQFGVRVYFDRPKEMEIKVRVDPQKLGTALSNLIDNGIKYNTQNGELIIKAERMAEKPYLKVSIHDTGIGVPADVMDKLFSKFFRSENAVRVATEGTGLGLYITKNIIERHGGEIWAESVLNRGTTFSFTLPLDFSLIPTKEIVYEEQI